MDGLPSIPGNPTPAASQAPPVAPAFNPQAVRAPGRPPIDPQAAFERDARHAEVRRLESILPKQATDSKIQVFRLKNGRIPIAAKPVVTILISDLEAAKQENGSDTSSDDYIMAQTEKKIMDRNGDPTGVYQCRVIDKHNKVLPTGVWEFEIGEGDDQDDDGDLDGDYVDDDRDVGDQMLRSQRTFTPAPIPPPAPNTDPVRIAAALREERVEEAKRGESMISVITAMMSAQQQAQVSSQQNMQGLIMQMQTMQLQMAEQSRKEAAERDERERARSAEFRQTLLTLAPTIIPLIQGLFKREERTDPTLPVLIEMVKSKPSDAQVLPAVMTILTETMKTSNDMHMKSATAAMEQQAKVTGNVTDMMMERMLKMVASVGQPEAPKEEGMLDTVAKLAPIIGPLLASQQAQAAPAQAPALPAPAPEDIVDPPQAQAPPQSPPQAPPRRRRSVPPVATTDPPTAPAQLQTQALQTQDQVSDDQRIQAVISTIVKMSKGEIKVPERGRALIWCAKTAPLTLRTAIQSGDPNQVIAVGAPVIGSDPGLTAWVMEPANQEFLMGCATEMKHLFDNTMTASIAKKGMQDQAAYLAARAGVPPAQPPAQPPAGNPTAPVVADNVPKATFANTSGAQVSLPVEVLTDTGWVPAAETLKVTAEGFVRGPVMEENDASWVVLISNNARTRVLKDKFMRKRTRRQSQEEGVSSDPPQPSAPEAATTPLPGQTTIPGVVSDAQQGNSEAGNNS